MLHFLLCFLLGCSFQSQKVLILKKYTQYNLRSADWSRRKPLLTASLACTIVHAAGVQHIFPPPSPRLEALGRQ